MRRHYYVTFLTPAGPGARFWRTRAGDLFLPAEYSSFTQEVARQATLVSRQLVAPEHVLIQGVIPLADEAARARWPEDFGLDGQDQA